MKKHYQTIADGLYQIYVEKTGKQSGSAQIIVYMMAQIAEFLHLGTAFEANSARMYFNSNEFLKHCEVLAVDDVVTKQILTTPPRSAREISG